MVGLRFGWSPGCQKMVYLPAGCPASAPEMAILHQPRSVSVPDELTIFGKAAQRTALHYPALRERSHPKCC